MRSLLRHKLAVAGVVALAAAGAGGAFAATQSRSNPRQALLNDVAKRLNVSPGKLSAAIQGAMLDRLKDAVTAGQLTQAEANRIKQRIEQGRLPFGPLGLGDGGWRHGPPFDGPPGALGRHGPLGAAASYLGLSDMKLMLELRSGKTLAQLAQTNGKSVTGLEHALLAAATSSLDRMVKAGWMTKAQEQRRLGRLSDRIDQLVEHGRIQIRPAEVAPPAGAPGASAGPPAPGPGPFGSPPPGA